MQRGSEYHLLSYVFPYLYDHPAEAGSLALLLEQIQKFQIEETIKRTCGMWELVCTLKTVEENS